MFKDAEIALRAPDEQWTTIPIGRGAEFKGVLAGPIRRVVCHHDGKASKPCRALITEGKVRCWCQTEPTSSRLYGYAPFITRDLQQVVVMLSATTTKKMQAYKHGQPIRLTRPDREKAALVPQMLLVEELGSELCRRIGNGAPADISWYLLAVLWHDNDLVRHFYGSTGTLRKNTATDTPKRVKKDTDTPAPTSTKAPALGSILRGIGNGGEDHNDG